jgi:hypothetical protein
MKQHLNDEHKRDYCNTQAHEEEKRTRGRFPLPIYQIIT